MLALILLVFAFVFFCIATFGWRSAATAPGLPVTSSWYGRFNFVAAGLALWVLVEIVGRAGHFN
jgi:hypothetical protein